jgi:hypothetical protein
MAYLGYIKLTPMGSIGMDNIPLIIFLNGLLSAGGVWLSHSLQEALERASTK